MTYIHRSGECKFKDCDKPSVIEGYCSFHYQLISQQRNVQVMSRMVELLGSMNDRLGYIENNLHIQLPINDNIIPEETINVNNITRKKESSVGFIPSINTDISSNVQMKNLKTDQTKRDILLIANKLNDISGE